MPKAVLSLPIGVRVLVLVRACDNKRQRLNVFKTMGFRQLQRQHLLMLPSSWRMQAFNIYLENCPHKGFNVSFYRILTLWKKGSWHMYMWIFYLTLFTGSFIVNEKGIQYIIRSFHMSTFHVNLSTPLTSQTKRALNIYIDAWAYDWRP